MLNTVVNSLTKTDKTSINQHYYIDVIIDFNESGNILKCHSGSENIRGESVESMFRGENFLDLKSIENGLSYNQTISSMMKQIRDNKPIELHLDSAIVFKRLIVSNIEHRQEGAEDLYQAKCRLFIGSSLMSRVNIIDEVSELIPGAFFKLKLVQNGKLVIQYLSKGIDKMTDYGPDYYINGEFKYFVHEEDRDQIEKFACHIPDISQNLFVEFRTFKRDGSVIWLEAKTKCNRNELGEIFYTGSLHEVTRRKEAEERIRDVQCRMKDFFYMSDDAYWDWDLINDSCYYSEGFHTLFGHEIDSPHFHVDNWKDRIHPDDQPLLYELLNEVITDEKSNDNWEHNYRYQRSDGSYSDVFTKGKVIRNQNGRVIRMIGVTRDISSSLKSRRTVETLREELDKTRNYYENVPIEITNLEETCTVFFRNSPIPKIEYNQNTLQIIDVNLAAINLYGFNRKEFLELKYSDLTESCELIPEGPSIAELLRKEFSHPERIECHISKTGKKIYVEMLPLEIKDSNEPKVLTALRNVTDFVNVGNILKNQNAKLMKIAWLQSHEVRAPLANIMGVINLINEEYNKDELKSYLDMLMTSACELDKVIQKIRNYTYDGMDKLPMS